MLLDDLVHVIETPQCGIGGHSPTLGARYLHLLIPTMGFRRAHPLDGRIAQR